MKTVNQVVKEVLKSDTAAKLLDRCSASDSYVDIKLFTKRLEALIIEAVVGVTGNRAQASYKLGLERTTLVMKLKKHGFTGSR